MKINCWEFISAFSAAILLAASSGIIAAADGAREVISVSLNAGDTYVIKNLGEDSTPAVHVVKNPNALIVHSGAPGQLVLLGADNGEWTIDVTNADGAPLTYKVDIHSIINFANPTKPGKAPATLGNPMSASGKAPAVAALDPGAGPVDSATTSAATKVAAAAPASAGAPAPATATAALIRVSRAPGEPLPPQLRARQSTGWLTRPRPRPPSGGPCTRQRGPVTAAGHPRRDAAAFLAAPGSARVRGGEQRLTDQACGIRYAPSSARAGRTAGGPMIPSQAGPSLAPSAVQSFKANPLAVPYSPSEAGPSGSNFLPNDFVIVMSGVVASL